MRILQALSIAALLAFAAAPSAAQDHGLTGEFIAPLPAPVTSIEVEFIDGMVSNSLIYRRYQNANAITTSDAELLKSSLVDALKRELGAQSLYASDGYSRGLTLSVRIMAVSPSDAGLTSSGFRMGVDPGGVARGGAALAAEIRDDRGELIGSFVYSGRDDWSSAHSKANAAWRAAESTFDRFAHHLAEVLATEGDGTGF